MTYQVLARKWRPKTFSELVGQEHVVQALTNALSRGRLHHAYLLTGTRGVGKTTIARILAKSLNCLTNGVSATPCGTCAACTDIDSGRFVDLLELDAASNTGIDNMREILDNARYAPTVGRYKVYLIDEVHMLSKAAFNSMLKTLEEPPEHVRFVLATTDPQKIPVTVLSRCLQFNLKQLPVPLIEGRLTSILAAESIAADVAAIVLIARAAQGSMRDALSLLDQAIAYGDGEVREVPVRTMLGAVDTEHVYRLVDALIKGDGPALLAEVDAMAGRSIAFAAALDALASLFHRVATVQVVPDATATMSDGERVAGYARAIAPELVQVAYQICVQGRNDLALAPDEATGFAMTLLRLLAFEPGGAARPAPSAGGAGNVANAKSTPVRARRCADRSCQRGAGVADARGNLRCGQRRSVARDSRRARGRRPRIGNRRYRIARRSDALAGVRREPQARWIRGPTRRANNAREECGARAGAGGSRGAAPPDHESLHRQAEARAGRDHRNQAAAHRRSHLG
jgi:DNA polymerase-3 subunit gamma/tau